MTISRREFIRTAALFALFVGTGPSQGAGYQIGHMSPGPKAIKAKRWGMAVDMKRCNEDCKGECMAACHQVHNVPHIPEAEHQVMWLFEKPYLNAFRERSDRLVSQRLRQQRFLLLCNHCDDPPCVRACPTQATFKRAEDGIVMIDYHRCIGCRFCMAACPYGSRSFNFRDPRPFIKRINPGYPTRQRGVVEKCNFCQDLLAVGRMPACVEACKEGALTFGDLDDPGSQLRNILDKRPHIRRKPSLGTRPSVFYLL